MGLSDDLDAGGGREAQERGGKCILTADWWCRAAEANKTL